MTQPPSPAPPWADAVDPRRWLYAGLAALFVLVGLSVVVSVLSSIWHGQVPSWSLSSAPWNWILGLIGIVIAVWIVVWMFRLLLWGVAGVPYHDGHWRHYYRHYHRYGPFGPDPAAEIARERFARGEITQDQLDQILGQLSKGYGP